MAYLDRYHDVRRDPRLLLPGARALLMVAFPYFTSEPLRLPVSLYARGLDYHEVVRSRLEAIATQYLGERDSWRVCVDTAPLRERYWAERSGLGFVGRNNTLIIPGLGSYFFIGSILTVAELPERRHIAPGEGGCGDCRRCVDSCPGHCLYSDGSAVDARRCLSYLTIEHRGEITVRRSLPTLYGCDVCQQVCPYNADVCPTPIQEFHPSERMRGLTAEDVAGMTPEEFSLTFARSSIRRTKLAGLLRNLSMLVR